MPGAPPADAHRGSDESMVPVLGTVLGTSGRERTQENTTSSEAGATEALELHGDAVERKPAQRTGENLKTAGLRGPYRFESCALRWTLLVLGRIGPLRLDHILDH